MSKVESHTDPGQRAWWQLTLQGQSPPSKPIEWHSVALPLGNASSLFYFPPAVPGIEHVLYKAGYYRDYYSYSSEQMDHELSPFRFSAYLHPAGTERGLCRDLHSGRCF